MDRVTRSGASSGTRVSTSECENLSARVPTEAREDAFSRRAAVILCEQDAVIVDWSSGVLKTNVGESRGVSVRGEEMLGPKSLQNSTTAQRNQLMADLAAAEAAREGAVTGKTHEDQARVCRRFRE